MKLKKQKNLKICALLIVPTLLVAGWGSVYANNRSDAQRVEGSVPQGLSQMQVLPVSNPKDRSVVLEDTISGWRFISPLMRCQKECLEQYQKQKIEGKDQDQEVLESKDNHVFVHQEEGYLIVEQTVHDSSKHTHKIKSTWQWDNVSSALILARSEWILIGAQGPIGKNTVEHRSGIVRTQWDNNERQCALNNPKTITFEWTSAFQLELLARQTCG